VVRDDDMLAETFDESSCRLLGATMKDEESIVDCATRRIRSANDGEKAEIMMKSWFNGKLRDRDSDGLRVGVYGTPTTLLLFSYGLYGLVVAKSPSRTSWFIR